MIGQISSKLRSAEGGLLTFWCPGCHETHQVSTGPNGWSYDGNAERPTFKPSVFIKSGHFMDSFKPGDSCWCTFNAKRLAEGREASRFTCKRCHTFVTAGRIQFLSDCSHALAGQTVDLPDLPEHLRDGSPG